MHVVTCTSWACICSICNIVKVLSVRQLPNCYGSSTNPREYCQNIDEPKTREGQTDFLTNVLPKGSSNTKKKFAAQLVGGRSEIGPRPFLTDAPYLKI